MGESALRSQTDISIKNSIHQLIQGPWMDRVLIALVLLALFATPLQIIRLATNLGEPLRITIASLFAIFSTVLILYFSASIVAKTSTVFEWVSSKPLWFLAIIGLLFRIVWIITFPTQPSSDGGTYLDLAQSMAETSIYSTANTRAYWPVGYPLFLTPWQILFPSNPINFLLPNLILFLICFLGTARLAEHLAGPNAGKFAAALISIWPNLIFNTATPEKEMLVLSILPWAMLLIIRTLDNERSAFSLIGAGLLLGAATLVQPSLQFLVPVGILLLVLTANSPTNGGWKAFLLLLGAALIITPWSVRNYNIFDSFVLVSTNGGDNLYRANNPLATGGYVAKGEIDLSDMGEIEQDQMGRRLAVEWIKSNPADFSKLVIEKQIRFMGDDSVGVYNALKVGKASDNPGLYAMLKAIANGWWILMWGLLAALAIRINRTGTRLPLFSRAPLWLWLYLFALHSIFESAGKYHVPMVWVPCVLIAVYLSSLQTRPVR
jgi:4-amino-4-deoxy-L-arabinose transferase-like glycosyltransferase